MEQLLAASPRVQNVLPEGSSWDGKSDLPMDEATFKQMLTEIEPAAGDSGAAQTASPPGPQPKGQPGPPKSGS
jgi:hypothetical protein